GEYNFATCTIATQLRAQSVTINKRKDQWHTPPVDALFIHRKIAGLYLIAKRLNAKVNVKQLFAKYVKEAK
ncbi:MAG: AarF/ABC1/UbiB kinase family protein, partial [Pseudoalteromonas spongiae]